MNDMNVHGFIEFLNRGSVIEHNEKNIHGILIYAL